MKGRIIINFNVDLVKLDWVCFNGQRHMVWHKSVTNLDPPTLGARHNTAREVLWKYADSIPNIVNMLWQKYFDSIVPYFDSTKGTEVVA